MLYLKKVESDDEISEVYKLRYNVYCQEKKFEEENEFPDQLEIDEYDVYAVHFLAKKNDRVVGTARMILNNPIGFPAEKHCKLDISLEGMKKERTVEVSRFAISKEAARSTGCNRQEIVLGLIREIVQEGRRLGIKYFYAAMAKSFQKILLQAGPEVDYHGKRAPYITWMKNIEDGLFMKDVSLYRYVIASGVFPYPMSDLAYTGK
jgi:N-acyl-L-homoserine lactone synthetase